MSRSSPTRTPNNNCCRERPLRKIRQSWFINGLAYEDQSGFDVDVPLHSDGK
jgi:hypothetical protein